MKKYLTILAAAALFAGTIHAQSSEKLSELLNSKDATYGQVSYLAAVYSDELSEEDSYETAVQKMVEKKLLKEGTDPSKAITLSELSYICTETAGLKGGLFYTLIPGPRYALRELKAKGIVPAGKDPSSKVNGREVIAVFNGVLPEDN